MDIKEQIIGLVQKYNLIDRTFDNFWNNYDSYLIEEPEEAESVGLVDKSSIEKPFLRSVYYTLTSANEHNDFELELLVVRLDFYHKEESGCALGEYTCEFTLSGELFDDFFVIY